MAAGKVLINSKLPHWQGWVSLSSGCGCTAKPANQRRAYKVSHLHDDATHAKCIVRFCTRCCVLFSPLQYRQGTCQTLFCVNDYL